MITDIYDHNTYILLSCKNYISKSYRHTCEELYTVVCVFNRYTCENEKTITKDTMFSEQFRHLIKYLFFNINFNCEDQIPFYVFLLIYMKNNKYHTYG